MTDRPAAADRPARRPGLGSVLANPAYRRLFAAQMVSRWGDTFSLVALVVLVFRLTGSGLGVSGVVWPRSRRCCCWRRWPAWSWTGCPACG